MSSLFSSSRSGLSNAAEYVTSGLPFAFSAAASTTAQEIKFPYVTNFISVHNADDTNDLEVGFTENGLAGSNKFFVAPGETRYLKIRIKTLFVASSAGTPIFDVVAGMTQILSKELPILTGSATQGTTGSFPFYEHTFGYNGIG